MISINSYSQQLLQIIYGKSYDGEFSNAIAMLQDGSRLVTGSCLEGILLVLCTFVNMQMMPLPIWLQIIPRSGPQWEVSLMDNKH